MAYKMIEWKNLMQSKKKELNRKEIIFWVEKK